MLKWSRRCSDLERDATFRDSPASDIQQQPMPTTKPPEIRRILLPSATANSTEKDALRSDIKTSEKARQIVEQILQIFDANIGVDSTVNSAGETGLKSCCNRCTG